MNTGSLTKFWPLMYSIVREIWEITEPRIETAAVKNGIPIELYYYSELGLEFFSIENFQQRDPFTNPEQFEKNFTRFDVKGWIIPLPDERYQVSGKAQEGVRQIVRAGDDQLAEFDQMSDSELKRLSSLLKRLTKANFEAPEPPGKWSIVNRFHVADEHSPLMVQIRENFMDLLAYRDDSHLSAARSHFGQAGIVWEVLGSIVNGSAVNGGQMAERMSLRAYEENDYEVAIQAALEIGWVEGAEFPNTFRATQKGQELREQVERLTDEYFYRSWSVFSPEEHEDLFALLTKLHDKLTVFRKSIPPDGHI